MVKQRARLLLYCCCECFWETRSGLLQFLNNHICLSRDSGPNCSFVFDTNLSVCQRHMHQFKYIYTYELYFLKSILKPRKLPLFTKKMLVMRSFVLMPQPLSFCQSSDGQLLGVCWRAALILPGQALLLLARGHHSHLAPRIMSHSASPSGSLSYLILWT